MFMIRQGDVLVMKCDEIPQEVSLIERDNERVVLAYGEATGHAHAIHEVHVNLYKSNSDNDNVYLEVIDTMAFLQHEEHSKIEIPAGKYQVIRQREYHPKEIRYVAD